MESLQVQAQESKGMVTRVEQEEAELKKKLTDLEENLNGSLPDKIKVWCATIIQNQTSHTITVQFFRK